MTMKRSKKITYNINNLEEAKKFTYLMPERSKKKFKMKEKMLLHNTYKKRIKPFNLILLIFLVLIANHALSFIRDANYFKSNNIAPYHEETDIANITFLGDVMMDRGAKRLADTKGYDAFFDKSKYLWEDSDVTIANLESTVLRNKKNFNKNDKEIHLAMNPKGPVAMNDAGIDIFNLANNHIGDFKRRGITNTLSVLEKNNLTYLGAGRNEQEALDYLTYELNGMKFAFVSVSDIIPKGSAAQLDKPGMLSTYNDNYLRVINHASKEVDKVIVYVHWGEEIPISISDRQRELGMEMIDSGASVIVGMHPHIIQPVETYNNGIIMYSIGNFVFEQEQTRAKDSVVVNMRVDKNKETTFEFVPMRIINSVPQVTTNGYYKKRTFNELTKFISEDLIVTKGDTIIFKPTNFK